MAPLGGYEKIIRLKKIKRLRAAKGKRGGGITRTYNKIYTRYSVEDDDMQKKKKLRQF